MGSGRLDVNGASVSVGFALYGQPSLLLLPAAWLGKASLRTWRTFVILGTFAVFSIPLLGMGARGGLVY